MRIERHKNFLTLEECTALNAWVDKGVENKWLDVGVSRRWDLGMPLWDHKYKKRATSRMYSHRFEYPQIALDISNRIRSFCGISTTPLIEGHGKNGIVVSCTFTGGDVYPHRDPQSKDNLAALRCNVMTRAADAGAELYVGGQLVDIEVGELHCYLASEFEHKVTEVQGDTSRVLWMFGAYVPTQEWESGKIQVGKLNGK
jgi:hypothetical protein